MNDSIKQRAGDVEGWAYQRGILGLVNAARTAGFSALMVLMVVAMFALWQPEEAAGAVEYAVVEEIARINASARGETTLVEQSILPRSVRLNVPSYLQNPLLPTGCESVALTDVLAYFGFDLTTTDIADEWLPLSATDFVYAFMGNPYSSEGNSCMAPCISQTASAYLTAPGSSLVAVDSTDMTIEDMLCVVAKGTPVIAWCTIDLVDPGEPYAVAQQDGRIYELYDSSHCVVVSGFNLDQNVVYVSDPLQGQVSYDLTLFASRYYKLGAQAVVLR